MIPNDPSSSRPDLIGGHVLGDLLVDHQLAMQAARSPASQHVAQQQERRVVVVEMGDGRPDQIEPVELDAIMEHDLGRVLSKAGAGTQGRRRGRTARQWARSSVPPAPSACS